ncbi:MAG TPA: YdcF family protein [Steroidobacteraceae bacterium]
MFVTLKTLLRTLILPPSGPLLAALAGIWMLYAIRTPRGRRAGWALLVAGIASLWLLSMPIVAGLLSRAAQRSPALDLTRPIRAQAIVILAGSKARAAAPEYGGEPAANGGLLERVAYGAYVARRTGLPVLVTGTATEAQAMRATLARDFSIQVRWVENQSRDTFDNAQLSANILRAQGITRVVLVTDAAHEWRATAEFESAGLGVVPAPVKMWAPSHHNVFSFLPSSMALLESTEAVYELLGDVARRAMAALHLRRHSS